MKLAEITESKKELNPKVIDLSDLDQESAYDHTQTSDEIKDGDVLDFGDGNVGIMIEAWPVVVFGKIQDFHKGLADGYTWDTLDGGKYKASYEKAKEAANK